MVQRRAGAAPLLAAAVVLALAWRPPGAAASCYISDICPGHRTSTDAIWCQSREKCPGKDERVIVDGLWRGGDHVIATCNFFGCNCDPCYACGSDRMMNGNPSCNDQQKCKDVGGCDAKCQNSNWETSCVKCGGGRRRSLLGLAAAAANGSVNTKCSRESDYLEFMALSDAELTTRLSDALCKGRSASGASVGTAFLAAVRAALDRDGDGRLSCEEYEMLANRCPFTNKLAKAKALPKPACKLSSQGKAVKAWWKKFVAVCYKNPLRLTNKALANPTLPKALITGYYESWSANWVSEAAKLDLANLPSYINVVAVSFAKPDLAYTKGSFNLDATGLGFWTGAGPIVRDAIVALKVRQPTTRVMLAVGGATFPAWNGLNVKGLKDLVDDFGFDGVDIDYEPSSPACTATGGRVSCASDAEFVRVTANLRKALPTGAYLLSLAGFSVGAYGEGSYASAKPVSEHTGVSLAVARTAAGQALDLINIMAYDAGNPGSTGFDPKVSFQAYKALFPNAAIALGVEVPPEQWGGNTLTLAQVDEFTAYVKANGGAGMMIWALKGKQGPPSPGDVTARMCAGLGLADCAVPLP